MPALLLQSAHRETLARANGFPGGRLPPPTPRSYHGGMSGTPRPVSWPQSPIAFHLPVYLESAELAGPGLGPQRCKTAEGAPGLRTSSRLPLCPLFP